MTVVQIVSGKIQKDVFVVCIFRNELLNLLVLGSSSSTEALFYGWKYISYQICIFRFVLFL